MAQTHEATGGLKKFYATTIRKNIKLGRSTEPIQVLGLTPANSDNTNANKPCTTHHVFEEDLNCFMFDFPNPLSLVDNQNVFYLHAKNVENPPYPNAEFNIKLVYINNVGVNRFERFVKTGDLEHYPNRSGVCVKWSAILSQYGGGEYYFYIPNTSVRSQTFILHNNNDLTFKNSSIVLKTKSKGNYRNFRYFEGGQEPIFHDVNNMILEDELRIQAHILPTPSSITKTIVQYKGYGQDIQQSDDQNTFDLQYKGLIATYIIRRFEFYALNSDIYLTDENTNSFDTYENKRCVYNESHDFSVALGQPYLQAPKFSMKNYRAMGFDNSIKII